MTQPIVNKVHNPVTMMGKNSAGNSEPINSTNNTAHTRLMGEGPLTTSSNRERPTVTTREKVTWTAAEDVTYITIVVINESATTTYDEALAITFDAADDAAANTALTETDSETGDVNRWIIPVGVPVSLDFSSALSRADFLSVGGDTLRVWIGAN